MAVLKNGDRIGVVILTQEGQKVTKVAFDVNLIY